MCNIQWYIISDEKGRWKEKHVLPEGSFVYDFLETKEMDWGSPNGDMDDPLGVVNQVNVVNPHQKHTVVIKKNTVGLRGIHHLSHLGFFLRSTLKKISFTIQLVFILFLVKTSDINYKHKNKDAVR